MRNIFSKYKYKKLTRASKYILQLFVNLYFSQVKLDDSLYDTYHLAQCFFLREVSDNPLFLEECDWIKKCFSLHYFIIFLKFTNSSDLF